MSKGLGIAPSHLTAPSNLQIVDNFAAPRGSGQPSENKRLIQKKCLPDLERGAQKTAEFSRSSPRAYRQNVNSSSLPTSVLDFETAWSEAQWIREISAEHRTSKRRSGTVDQFFIDRSNSRRDAVRRRLKDGFRCFGETVGGRYRRPFVEHGLRSTDHHVLRRLVHLTPRVSSFQSGRDKAVMSKTDAKVLALDEPWIVLNTKVRGVFRVDLDVTFRSWETLRFEVEQLDLPCLPHCIVGHELPDGSIERPHLLFLLPFGSEVWFDPDDARCRRDIMSLWRGVHAGITKAFLSLGADPGALANPMRIKNPMSPFWEFQIWNESKFPDLSEWAGWVDTSTSRDAMIRESAKELSKLDGAASNSLFTMLQRRAFDVLRQMRAANEGIYTGSMLSDDRDKLAEALFNRLLPEVVTMAANPRQAMAVLYRVAPFAATRWDPVRAGRDDRKDRGACSADVEGLVLRERQAVGGKYGAAERARKSVETIREAIAVSRAEGRKISKSEISRRTGMSRTTIHAHWRAALSE